MTSDLLPISTFGDPILREMARPVTEFGDELSEILRRMHLTLAAAGGGGLAGNQVGLLRRVFVWRSDNSSGHCVNPDVLETSDDIVFDDEGCMSFPRSFRFELARAREVRVRFQDNRGTQEELMVSGRLARTFLHEIDHLNGILFIDHLAAHDLARAKAAIDQGDLDAIPQPNGGPSPVHGERVYVP